MYSDYQEFKYILTNINQNTLLLEDEVKNQNVNIFSTSEEVLRKKIQAQNNLQTMLLSKEAYIKEYMKKLSLNEINNAFIVVNSESLKKVLEKWKFELLLAPKPNQARKKI